MTQLHRPRFGRLLSRALRLRCPQCGQSKLFTNLFFWSMKKTCDVCGMTYEREPGFFLGTIYFNYGLTSLVVAIAFPVMTFVYGMSQQKALAITMAFTLVFPFWFFRYARSLWLGFDQFMDPPQGDSTKSSRE